MTRKHRHRPSPSSPEFSVSSSAAGGKPHRGILREKKTEDDDGDYSDDSASQSLYDESQGDEYEPSEKHDDIESVSNAHDDSSSSQKHTRYIPESNNIIQGKNSSMLASNLLNLSHPMTSYIKIAPLPIFRGTSTECPITHLSRFNKVCRANGASSIDMCMRIFPVTLEEEAALWYDLNIEPYPSLTWDEIKSSFLEAYHRIELVEELRAELMRINQGKDESVRTYFLRLQRILQRWPEHGLSEALLKGVFVDGLRKEFQEWILLQKPNSVNDALRLAFSYEEMRSIRISRKEVVECCGFCEGMHEERECEVREGMRALWRESQRSGREEDFVRSISMGTRSDSEKVDEVINNGLNKMMMMKKKGECQCMKHQCSNKNLLRNMSLASTTTSFPDAA